MTRDAPATGRTWPYGVQLVLASASMVIGLSIGCGLGPLHNGWWSPAICAVSGVWYLRVERPFSLALCERRDQAYSVMATEWCVLLGIMLAAGCVLARRAMEFRHDGG